MSDRSKTDGSPFPGDTALLLSEVDDLLRAKLIQAEASGIGTDALNQQANWFDRIVEMLEAGADGAGPRYDKTAREAAYQFLADCFMERSAVIYNPDNGLTADEINSFIKQTQHKMRQIRYLLLSL